MFPNHGITSKDNSFICLLCFGQHCVKWWWGSWNMVSFCRGATTTALARARLSATDGAYKATSTTIDCRVRRARRSCRESSRPLVSLQAEQTQCRWRWIFGSRLSISKGPTVPWLWQSSSRTWCYFQSKSAFSKPLLNAGFRRSGWFVRF